MLLADGRDEQVAVEHELGALDRHRPATTAAVEVAQRLVLALHGDDATVVDDGLDGVGQVVDDARPRARPRGFLRRRPACRRERGDRRC